MAAGLSVEHLAVSLGAGPLFAPQSFALEPGRVLGVMGPSGRGKSTMLRAIAQLIPSDGEIRLGGRTPEELGWPTFRRRVVYVHQQPLFVAGSVADNLARPFAYRSRGAGYDAAEATRLLAAVGLGASLLARASHTLSVGEGQRVSVVRALLLAPDVLLLDEPTSALDAAHRAHVEGLLLDRLAAGACSAIIVTHDAAQAERLGAELRTLTAESAA